MLNATRPQPLQQPAASDVAIEELARRAYDVCHRDDTFEDLRHRAEFSREAAGLLRAWLHAARLETIAPTLSHA